jgi:hypothetical protein
MEHLDLPQEIFDPTVIVQIYNTIGSTRKIAAKYKVKTYTIARIRGGTRQYQAIIENYLKQMQIYLWRQQYGYDPLTNYYPPPWGKENHTPEKISEHANADLKNCA